MASETGQQRGFFQRAAGAVSRNGYLGGELQAAVRQGFNEIGAALKAFPDSIQVEEPGAAFNPLYRDMAGNSQPSDRPAMAFPSPSQIAEGTSPGPERGNGQERGQQPAAANAGEAAPGRPLSPGDIAEGKAAGQVMGEQQQARQQNAPSPSEIAEGQEPQQGQQQGQGIAQGQSQNRGRGM